MNVYRNRDGLLFTKYKSGPKPKGLRNPYSVIYVAQSVSGVDRCILGFVEMITKKYHKKYKKLDVVIPPWFVDENMESRIKKRISKYYPNILIKQKDKDELYINRGTQRNNNTLTFRCDVLPVPNNVMKNLMKHSINDILLTGDQSITDALSCCSNKNIFYQIAPWKKDFGKNLARLLPNTYLSKVSTSCGTLKAIRYRSNYTNFVNKWDFRKIGKPKLDAIMKSIYATKNNKFFRELVQLIDKSRTLPSLKKKIRDIYN